MYPYSPVLNPYQQPPNAYAPYPPDPGMGMVPYRPAVGGFGSGGALQTQGYLPSSLPMGQSSFLQGSPPPPSPAPSASQDQLLMLIHEMRVQMDQLRLRLNSMSLDGKGPDLKIRWPIQQAAGVLEFPDLLPYPMFFGLQELTEPAGAQVATFGTTGQDATTTISLNTVYSYLTDIGLFAFRETAPQGSPLGTGFWLPHTPGQSFADASLTPYQGFDFFFGLRLQSDGIALQTNMFPSRILAFSDGLMKLPFQFRLKTGDNLLVNARPLRLAQQGERIRLFVALWGYQMRDGKQIAKL